MASPSRLRLARRCFGGIGMSALYVLRGDARRKKLDTIQQRIDALMAEKSGVELSNRPLEEIREQLGAEAPPYSGLRRVALNQQGDRDSRVTLNAFSEPLTLADLEWLFGRDMILDQVVSALALEPANERTAIGASQFSQRLADIDRQLRETYEEEEREVLRLYDAGIKAVRRENSDGGLIFNLWNNEETKHVQA